MIVFTKSDKKTVAEPALTEAERKAKWDLQDKELERFCQYGETQADKPAVYEVDVPDIWNVALTFVSGEERRKSRRESRSTGKKASTKAEPAPPAQLSSEQIDDLKFYWEVFPSLCGLRSSWHEQAEAMDECAKCGARYPAKSKRITCPNPECDHYRGSFHTNSYMRVASGAGSSWHPSYDSEMIGLASGGQVERANRVRDTLIEMVDRGDSKLVNVLWLAYGDQNAFAPWAKFGTLAQLVGLTKAASKACGGKFNREALDDALRAVGGTELAAVIQVQSAKLLSLAAASFIRAAKEV